MIISILIVAATLSLLVFIHELGHFIAAKRSGVEVREFGFGFPPRLFGVKRGGTIFSINLIPLGGFVKLKGDLENEGGSGNFTQASYGRKSKILLAGVAMNLLVGYLLLVFLAITGLPPVPGVNPNQRGVTYVQPPQVIVSEVLNGSAAQRAGFKKGDVVLSANDEVITGPKQLQQFTSHHAGDLVNFKIKRGNHTFDQAATLSGTGQLGIGLQSAYLIKYSPLPALLVSAKLVVQIIASTIGGFFKAIFNLPKIIGGSFGKNRPAAANGVIGPVGIVSIVSGILYLGFRYILILVTLISISLAVINTLPIPVLDGGRWLLITINKLARRDLTKPIESFLFGLSYAFLIVLIVTVTYLDIRFH